MVSLREGAYQFGQRSREGCDVVLESLIDPDGETVQSLAEVEGDVGAVALAQSLELIQFDTWLFGQIGDKDELDLNDEHHRTTWFSFGAWIGETLRRRHGGHWLLLGEDPHGWRIVFSKIFLEIAPFVFAEQLIRMGSGATRKMVTEIDKVRVQHSEQEAKDGRAVDRFNPQHYIRYHTVPLGQWLQMDFAALAKLWNEAPARDLVAAVREAGPRHGPANAPLVERLVQALSGAKQDKPLVEQTRDKSLFEAVAQIVALRGATQPLAIDILERIVMPAMHVGIPDTFPPLDADDFAQLREGMEPFAFFVDVVPHTFAADDTGLLGSIPSTQLQTPYGEKTTLEIGKGDWVLVNAGHLAPMLKDLDPQRLIDKYDAFVKYVGEQPDAPRLRNDGRALAELSVRALAELRACVSATMNAQHALVFRLLPPPG